MRKRKESRRKARFANEEVPLYYQLATILREMILSGQYTAGEQIPTELRLVEDYCVSRITVRQSLRLLEDEGLIRREVGRGTFVADRISSPSPLKTDGTLDDLISLGLATSVKLLDFRTVAAAAEDAEALRIEPGATLVRCTRLRYHRRKPYCLVVNVLPESIGRQLTRKYLRKGSILHYIEKIKGLRLRDAEQTVQATLAEPTLAQMLQTRIGAPLLFVNRMVWAVDGTPVERVRTHYRGDMFSLSVHLERDSVRPESTNGWTLRDSRERQVR